MSAGFDVDGDRPYMEEVNVSETEWNHRYLDANCIKIHHVRHGAGFPLVLLHGWPEFWLTWRKNVHPLAESFDIVAPDIRGFGETEKPDLPVLEGYSLDVLVEDLKGLVDALNFEKFGIVSHDIGAYIAQGFARKYPDRLRGLLFFNCPYPGIGCRWVEPDHLGEIWYQSFNQQSWAASLVGASRQTCELYISLFLSHWSHAPNAFEEDIAS